MEFLSKSLKETTKIASDFAKSLQNKGQKALVVGLYGELGSGKTTFMKYLAEVLGLREVIQSPTFVIMKKYHLVPISSKLSAPNLSHLIHIDAYRIESGEEMKILGWEKLISDPKNLICVEWPERISEIIPKHVVIKFEHVSENKRKIKIE
ncbi:MAG: tRNA (adenosine(37)-N6)-threonylcarbamoyltransferase complex ATPase subunit type 1 TsaE [Candidatus Zambryskibacteria bacterium]|nr:tRNA (adenosine(37)-N6)-threonylcarbamoyltransferase complex ATPase subunit type 1 TsaE [Candidatus Zambryskibacteria bacterium]